jgi:TatD DNase family protein
MKIDIHRHANDPGTAKRVIRNLFHNQANEIESNQYYSIGLHPWHVNAATLKSDIEKVREAARNTQIIAIGETGLDKSIKIPFDLQEKAFSEQIEIAKEFKKPIIIHCVRAYNEVFSLRLESKHNKSWIIHWFNASLEMGEQLINKNFYLSFGHMLFNKRSKAYTAFARLPEDRILLETDDAGCTINEVYQQASLLRRINISKLEQQVKLNFINCFGVKP